MNAHYTIKVRERLNKPQFVRLYNNGLYLASAWGTAKVDYTLRHYPPDDISGARYLVTVYDGHGPAAFFHVDGILRSPFP